MSNGFDNDLMFAQNADFTNSASGPAYANGLQTNGQLWIGATTANIGGTNINVGTITSPLKTLNVGYSSPNITLDVATNISPSTIAPTNLGITYSSGTFTVTAANGTALSATNYAYVPVASPTTGQTIVYTINTPSTFTDAAGTNGIGANTFGITSGVAYGADMPFFLYLITNSAGTGYAFSITRCPWSVQAAGSGQMAVAGGSANASTFASMFLLKNNGVNPTIANFASQPCVYLGCFRMQATSTPAWTVQSLSIGDGIGLNYDARWFGMPSGQFGANSGAFFMASNTLPTFSSQACNFKINRLREVSVAWDAAEVTQTGSGSSVVMYFVLPTNIFFTSYTYTPPAVVSYFNSAGTTATQAYLLAIITSGQNYLAMYPSSGAASPLYTTSWSNQTDLSVMVTYTST